MSECFCRFNGYEVKDAAARRAVGTLEANVKMLESRTASAGASDVASSSFPLHFDFGAISDPSLKIRISTGYIPIYGDYHIRNEAASNALTMGIEEYSEDVSDYVSLGGAKYAEFTRLKSDTHGRCYIRIWFAKADGSEFTQAELDAVNDNSVIFTDAIIPKKVSDNLFLSGFAIGEKAEASVKNVSGIRMCSPIMENHAGMKIWNYGYKTKGFTLYPAYFDSDFNWVKDGEYIYNWGTTEDYPYMRLVAGYTGNKAMTADDVSAINSGAVCVKPKFARGTITSDDGSENDAASVVGIRMRTDEYLWCEDAIITITDPEKYKVDVTTYDSGKSYIGYSGWIDTKHMRIRNAFARMVVAHVADPSEEFTLEEIATMDPFTISEGIQIEEIGERTLIGYPGYYDKEIENSIESVFDQTGKDTVSYIVITDTHDDEKCGNDEAMMNQFGSIVDVCRSCKIDFIVMCGDITSGGFDDTKIALKKYTQHYKKLSEAGVPVLYVRGNHDDCTHGATPAQRSKIITRKEFFARLIAPTAGNVVSDNLTYYHHDFPDQDLRVIVLDYMDYPEELTTEGYYKYTGGQGNWRGYSADQIKWMCETLKSNEAEKVVIFTHNPTIPALNDGIAHTNRETVEAVMRAYNAKTSYTFGGVTYNFSGAKGKIIVQNSGHNHSFGMVEDSGIVYINTGSSDVKITEASCFRKTGYLAMGERITGTISEAHYNIVTISNDKVKAIAFGAMDDLEVNL